MRRTENARLCLAAFPHWSRAILRMNYTPAERDEQYAEMAEQALNAGWAVASGDPVAPYGWSDRPAEPETTEEGDGRR